ncbi:MAG: cob(I)yrinic acid a,c-diamide adenosyltransferase [Thermodesulfovibrionales bacterium]|nr:cob(I)yrinic acid a,c-diamide adenosyltransferase [Thermodesulfovibrionales bacterium]
MCSLRDLSFAKYLTDSAENRNTEKKEGKPVEDSELKFLEPKKKSGLIVVLTGDGKGKTTSALGMALRAAGYDMRVCIIQFMKGDMHAGEIDGLKKLSPAVEFHTTGKGFCGIRGDSHSHEEHRKNAQKAAEMAKQKMLSGKFDMLILDEINNAVLLKLVDLSQVLDLVEKKPPLLHLILTGRDAHPELIAKAHTVTEMKEVKHAYRQGIEPQKGIDY